MRRELPKDPDPLLALARAAARKGRKRSVVPALIAGAVLIALLAVVLWFTWPTPDPPQLFVVAFDEAAGPVEEATLRARLEPVGGPEDVDLAGRDLFFAESVLGGSGRKKDGQQLQARATTDADGMAAVTWRFPMSDQPAPFVVRYPGDRRHPAARDMARVFTWPADARLLVVEARHALLDVDEARFRKANPIALQPVPGAAAALQKARAKNYHVVYLAVAPERPADYARLRGWLQRPAARGGPLFPDGPALGRPDYGDECDEAAARRAVLGRLKKRFRGPLVGIVNRPADARAFREAGLTTFLVGEPAKAPRHVRAIKSWDELPGKLP